MRLVSTIRPIALVLAGASLVAGPALAVPATYKIDPAHSEVGFTIRHIFTKVRGRFTRFSGTIVYDPQDLSASRVDAEIEAASVSTDNERRDADLRSPNFFLVDSFPKLSFTSKSVKAGQNGTILVNGDLTIHGVTRPVTLAAGFLGAGPAMGGTTRAGFEGSAKVDRKNFGINWNRTLDSGGLMLGDDVDIAINIEAVLQPSQVPPAAKKN